MTNGVNVEFIVDKLLTFLASSSDDHFRSDLVNQITQCAERFAPSNTWYVQTIIRVFQLAGDKVKLAVAQTLTQLIAEGAEIDDDDEDVIGAKDDELRSEAVEHFLDLIGKPKLPPILAQTMAWVLGEYGYLSVSCSKEVIMDKLCQLAQDAVEPETKAAVMTALSKLIAQSGTCPSKVLQMIQFYAQSKSLDLQQRCIEVLALLKHSDTMADVLPVDASCEDIDVDESLSFLQNFVQQALNNGARRYEPPANFYSEDDESSKKTQLKITPYAMPTIPAVAPSAGIVQSLPSTTSAAATGPTPLGPAINNRQSTPLSINSSQGNQLINTRGAAQVWGKKPEPPPPAPTPVPEPVQVQSYIPEPVSVPSPTVPQLHGVSGGMWGASAGAAPAPAPVAPVEPPRPRELTEKEKMAAALFGGVGGKPAAGAGAAANRRKSAIGGNTSAPVSAAPSANNSPAPAVVMGTPDLFSGMSAPVPTQLPPAHATGAPAMELLDMLSDEPMVPTHAPPPPIQHIPVPAPINDFGGGLLDLGMAPLAPTPAPVMQSNPPPVPAPAMNLISDVFGSMDLSGGGTTLSSNIDSGMRPLVINTQEYGRRWGMSPVDAKASVPCNHLSRLDLDTIRRSMPAHFHHVESIPNTLESIYASTVTTVGAVVLVHMKLQPARRAVDVTVKSTSQEICQREASTINLAISNFRG